MTDLGSLVTFAQVMEAGGFSAASRRTGTPVSTISRRVAELEDRLGVRLLERSTRRLRLTDIGAKVLEQARRGLDIDDAVADIVSNQTTRVAGVLRISAPPSLSEALLVPLLTAFRSRHPDVTAEVLVTDRYVDLIAEGVDVAFRVGPLQDSSLVARRLVRFSNVLLSSPDYLAERSPPRDPSDLTMHRLCTFAFWMQASSWSFAKGDEQRTVPVRPHLAMNDYAGLIAALARGAGIGDVPMIVVPDWRRHPGLIEVIPEWRMAERELFVVHGGGRHVRRAVRLFVDFAVEQGRSIYGDL